MKRGLIKENGWKKTDRRIDKRKVEMWVQRLKIKWGNIYVTQKPKINKANKKNFGISIWNRKTVKQEKHIIQITNRKKKKKL